MENNSNNNSNNKNNNTPSSLPSRPASASTSVDSWRRYTTMSHRKKTRCNLITCLVDARAERHMSLSAPQLQYTTTTTAKASSTTTTTTKASTQETTKEAENPFARTSVDKEVLWKLQRLHLSESRLFSHSHSKKKQKQQERDHDKKASPTTNNTTEIEFCWQGMMSTTDDNNNTCSSQNDGSSSSSSSSKDPVPDTVLKNLEQFRLDTGKQQQSGVTPQKKRWNDSIYCNDFLQEQPLTGNRQSPTAPATATAAESAAKPSTTTTTTTTTSTTTRANVKASVVSHLLQDNLVGVDNHNHQHQKVQNNNNNNNNNNKNNNNVINSGIDAVIKMQRMQGKRVRIITQRQVEDAVQRGEAIEIACIVCQTKLLATRDMFPGMVYCPQCGAIAPSDVYTSS